MSKKYLIGFGHGAMICPLITSTFYTAFSRAAPLK